MRFYQSIENHARTNKQKPAVITCQGICSYEELWQLICGCAEEIKRLGICHNDVVGLIYSNQLIFIALMYALNILKTPAVLLGSNLKQQELDKLIDNSEVSVLLAANQQEILLEHMQEFQVQNCSFIYDSVFIRLNCKKHGDRQFQYFTDDFIAQVTSGSNGFPKISIRSEASVLAEVVHTSAVIQMNENDVVMTIPPIYHSYGLIVGVFTPLHMGSTLVLVDQFIGADVYSLIRMHTPTIMIAVPYMYNILNKTAIQRNDNEQMRGSGRLRLCLSAGASMDPAVSESFAGIFGVNITQDYGSTETGVICIGREGKSEMYWVGFPVGTTEVGIFDEDRKLLKVGETGRLGIRSEWIARAYISPKECNRTVFHDGWFFTNDIGKAESDGSIFVMGRSGDMMNVAGNKVDPDEVEKIIRLYSSIAEAAVVCHHNESIGDVIIAFVVSDEAIDAGMLLRHCREHLSGYKLPRKIVQIEKLPRSRTGKILKKELLQMEFA